MSKSPDPLYLSRLILNPRCRQVMKEIAYPYEMHRTLMRAFPAATNKRERKARDEFGVLFRCEADDLSRGVKVFVQSCREPDWRFLDELNGYLAPVGDSCACKDIGPALQNLSEGRLLSFRLRANPTKRVCKIEDPMAGKRVQLTREEDQIGWLVRHGYGSKGAPGGFEPLMRKTGNGGEETAIYRVNVNPQGKQIGRKEDEHGKKHTTTHLTVLYEGLLRVTDPDAFRKTLIHGIGPAKAFGFGLLSVAPARMG